MTRVTGKVVLITGAGSGIGQASAIKLAEEGAQVVVCDIDQSGLEATCKQLNPNNLYLSLTLDVTRNDAWKEALTLIIKQFGRLDGLVNCAGIVMQKSIADTTLESFRRIHKVNLEGPFLGIKHCYEAMRTNPEGGSIVNVSSILGQIGMANHIAYSSSKGGLRLLTKAAALEFGATNSKIRVNSIHPGTIWTSMVTDLVGEAPETKAMMASMAPLNRVGEPSDIANAVTYLMSDSSRFVTGSELTIDGGTTAGLHLATAQSSGE